MALWNLFRNKPTDLTTAPEPGEDVSTVEKPAPDDPSDPSPVREKNEKPERQFSGAFVPAAFHPPGGVPQKSARPAPTSAGDREIVLTLGDLLPRIPPHLLNVTAPDPKTPLRFQAREIVTDVACGRMGLRLGRIAALCPQVFGPNIGAHEDIEIPLPLQKLLAQISAFPPTSTRAASRTPAAPVASSKQMATGHSEPDSPPPRPAEEPRARRFVPPPPKLPNVPAAGEAPVTEKVESPPPAPAETATQAETPAPAESTGGDRAPATPFDQTKLQSLLLTSDHLDPEKVAKLVAEFPGVGGCVLCAHGVHRAGTVPEELGVDALQKQAAEWKSALSQLNFGVPFALTVHCQGRVATVFAAGGASLLVFQGDFGLLPGYAEKLAAILDEVSGMILPPAATTVD